MTNLYSAQWTILIMSTFLSTIIAVTMNSSLHEELPDVKPYNWGYFTGWAGALNGAAFAVVNFMSAINASPYNDVERNILYLLGGYCLVAGIAHIFVIKRNKWGWVISIILQLNPVLWIINGIYLKNRWNEMSGTSVNVPEVLNTLGVRFKQLDLPFRSIIAGSAFWVLAVLAFVLVFNPYGSYIENKEQWQIIKIIIFPPLLIVVGYYLYIKVIKQK